MPRLPERDLDHVVEHAARAFGSLRGARILVTGGTGFFGRWLVESLLRADERLGLGVSVDLLSRDPDGFARRAPHVAAHRRVHLFAGDVRSFEPREGTFTHLIHGATETTGTLNAERPLELIETIVDGTRRALEVAATRSVSRVLLLSSGAVYGRQPATLTHVPETHSGGPDILEPLQAYAEGKRTAELIGAIYARDRALQIVTARCFAFVGPLLPLDAHFAAGNFIRDALHEDSIRVAGDGTPYRSYLHAADLAVWLWVLLASGRTGRAYNVGSEEDVTVRQLAHAVADAARRINRTISVSVAQAANPHAQPSRYVPSTLRAREELHLQCHIPLDEALARTLGWYSQHADMVDGITPAYSTHP